MLPGDANVVIDAALFQNRLPVAPSYACSTAGVPWPPAVDGMPVDRAKTTPLTMTGVGGDDRLWETQPGASDNAPPSSVIFRATTDPDPAGPFVAVTPAASAPETGSRIHDVELPPADCCQAASASRLTVAPAPTNGFEARSGVA